MNFRIKTLQVHDSVGGGFDAFAFVNGEARKVFHAETRQAAINRAAEWILLGSEREPLPTWEERPVSDAALRVIPGVDDESYAAGWGER